ncbi:trypsin-like peptidase domain-containing protein [Mixta calida]|nr:trypsin-like peptidase domain-containing protein [Mixta calida]
MINGNLEEFNLECIYLLSALLPNASIRRGTCFSIAKDLLLTANHVVNGASSIQIFLSSDLFSLGQGIDAECIYSNENLDIAILVVPEGTTNNAMPLYSTGVNLDSDVKSCGYPVEKEHYHAPIRVKVTNTFSHMSSREYSFEVSQSNTVTKYSGMSGSPIMHEKYCIGILLVQQGGNTLYALSVKDFLIDTVLQDIMNK